MNLQKTKLRLVMLAKTNNNEKPKKFGDKVIIHDWSYSIDKKGKHHHAFSGYDEKVGVITQTNCEKIVPTYSSSKNLDIVVTFPDGNTIFTSSDFVKLV